MLNRIKQEIKQLKQKGDLEKLKEKCKGLPEDDEESQVLHISMLAYIGVEENLEEIKKIANGIFKYSERLQEKYMDILLTELGEEKDQKKRMIYMTEMKYVGDKKTLKNNRKIQGVHALNLSNIINIEKNPEKKKAYIQELIEVVNGEILKDNGEAQARLMDVLWKQVGETIDTEERKEYIREIIRIGSKEETLRNSEQVQERWISILEDAKIKNSLEIIISVANREKLKNSVCLQAKFICILKERIQRERKLEKIKVYIAYAKNVAKREELKNNTAIQGEIISFLKVLIKREKDSETIEKYKETIRKIANREEFKDSEKVQIEYIYALRDLGLEEHFGEIKEICRRDNLQDSVEVQKAYISILKDIGLEEHLSEIKEICRRDNLQDSVEVQKAYISILKDLGLEEHFGEIKEICKRDSLKNNVDIQQKWKKILRIMNQLNNEKEKESKKFKDKVPEPNLKRKKSLQQETSNEMSDKKEVNPFLDRIKTKLYHNDVDTKLINQIKQDEENLSELERTVALVAIYDKQNNIKTATKLIKQAKRIFEGDREIVKELNIIHQAMLVNKRRIFDWGNYNRILAWNLDNNVAEEIKSKREREEKETEEAKAKARTRSREKDEISEKAEVKQPEKPQKPQRRMRTVKPKKDTSTQRYETKKKTNNKKKNTNEKTKGQLIENVFEKELDTIRKQILKGKREIVYEDNRLEVSSKYDKVPPEAVEELREKMQKEKDLTEDYCLVQTIFQKSILDLRAKMQMVLLLRKYNMKEVADEKLKEESEIYDNLNKVIYEQRRLKRITKIQAKRKKANPEYDKSDIIKLLESRVSEITQDTMDKISQVKGNNEFTYKLLNREAIDEERS